MKDIHRSMSQTHFQTIWSKIVYFSKNLPKFEFRNFENNIFTRFLAPKACKNCTNDKNTDFFKKNAQKTYLAKFWSKWAKMGLWHDFLCRSFIWVQEFWKFPFLANFWPPKDSKIAKKNNILTFTLKFTYDHALVALYNFSDYFLRRDFLGENWTLGQFDYRIGSLELRGKWAHFRN